MYAIAQGLEIIEFLNFAYRRLHFRQLSIRLVLMRIVVPVITVAQDDPPRISHIANESHQVSL